MEFSHSLGGKTPPHFPDIQCIAQSWGMSPKGKEDGSYTIS